MDKKKKLQVKEIVEVVKGGVTLNGTADIAKRLKSSGIGYIKTLPANHFANYFEYILDPLKSDKAILLEEIHANNPLCSFCHRIRASECIGHRVGIQLQFLYIQPQFCRIFIKFLNAVCLNPADLGASIITSFKGCCHPGSEPKASKSISSKLVAAKKKCIRCGVERPGKATTHKFASGRHGDLIYIKDSKEIPVSINALMEFFTKPDIKEHVLKSAMEYDMNIDIRSIITDKLYLLPYQLRPSISGKMNYDSNLYHNIAMACSNVDAGAIDSINTYSQPSTRQSVFQGIAELMSPKPQAPEKKTIFNSLSTKQGIIRKHIIAACVPNIGRAVIIPSSGNIGEFFVSRFYQNLNTSDTIIKYNLELYRMLGVEGLIKWVRPRGSNQTIKYNPTIRLQIGDVIWRCILTGDPVVANRQPTLHRLSQMGHFVRMFRNIDEGAVFGLYRSETTPTGADHDGDEMNLFVAPNFAAQLEQRSHAHVINNIQGSGGPAMAVIFHELAVMMILSIIADLPVKNPSDYISAYTQTFDLERRLKSYKRRRSIVLGVPSDTPVIRTYRDVCSLLFPEDFSYKNKGLDIRYGVLVSGEFDKKNIGIGSGSVTHILSCYPAKRAALFINDVGRVCDTYSRSNAISFNPEDMVHSEKYYAEIAMIVNSTRSQLENLLQIKGITRSEQERDRIERRIALLASAPIAQINQGVEQTKKIWSDKLSDVKKTGDDEAIERCRIEGALARIHNVFEIMYKSGCRGSEENARQMAMTLGVQYTDKDRTDASEMVWIKNPRAWRNPDGSIKQTILGGGIIDSSFMMGLTPEQYAIHAAPVRNQVVKGKLEIASSGYIGKQIATIYGQFYTAKDMCVISADTVVATSVGGFLSPNSLIGSKSRGHGCATFIDVGVLASMTRYRLMPEN